MTRLLAVALSWNLSPRAFRVPERAFPVTHQKKSQITYDKPRQHLRWRQAKEVLGTLEPSPQSMSVV